VTKAATGRHRFPIPDVDYWIQLDRNVGILNRVRVLVEIIEHKTNQQHNGVLTMKPAMNGVCEVYLHSFASTRQQERMRSTNSRPSLASTFRRHDTLTRMTAGRVRCLDDLPVFSPGIA
jgi:hypothetical protein